MKALSFFFLFFICVYAHAARYYVSSAGDDSNNGTSESTPWKTIAKINGRTFLPGDSILFKRGDTWREQLTISSSGSEGKPITFGAYGIGNKPIINAADIITNWENAGNDRWYVESPNIVPTRAMVFIGGTLFSETSSLADVNSASKYFIDASKSPYRLYVYSTVDPSTLKAEISKRDYCILSDAYPPKHHINIINIECRLAGRHGVGLFATEGSAAFNGSFIVDSCYFYACRIMGCTAYDRHSNDIFRNSSADYCGNGFYAWKADGISFVNCTTSNSINDTLLPNYSDGHGFGAYKSVNWLVENCVSTNDADGIHPDCGGLPANYIIRYNKIFNTKVNSPCIGVGSMGPGGVGQIYYNLLVNGSNSAFESYTPNLGTVSLYNNTIVTSASGGTNASVYLVYGSNFVFKNNILYRDRGDLKTILMILFPGLPTSDYNQFYQTTPSVAKRDFHYNGTYYTTLSGWQAGVNRDKNSRTGNPMFVNTLSDWSLQKGSPCIDAGIDVGLTRDILGNPIVGKPDLGAFEFPAATAPPVTQTPSAKAIQVNICGSDPYNNTTWNNWNIGNVETSNITSTSFKYADGTISTVAATLSHTSPLLDNGPSYGGGMAPAEVLRYSSGSNLLRTLTLGGLSTSKTYSLDIYASCGLPAQGSSVFTCNGTSVDVDVVNNLINKATFTKIQPNASGQIVVGINKTITNNFINGFVLTEDSTNTLSSAPPDTIQTVPAPVPQASAPISVYPNPVTDDLLLKLNSNFTGPVQVQIANVTGSLQRYFRLVKSDVKLQQSLPTNDMAAGIYFIIVRSGDQRQAVQFYKR